MKVRTWPWTGPLTGLWPIPGPLAASDDMSTALDNIQGPQTALSPRCPHAHSPVHPCALALVYLFTQALSYPLTWVSFHLCAFMPFYLCALLTKHPQTLSPVCPRALSPKNITACSLEVSSPPLCRVTTPSTSTEQQQMASIGPHHFPRFWDKCWNQQPRWL